MTMESNITGPVSAASLVDHITLQMKLDYVKGTVSQGYTENPLQGASGFQIYSCFIMAVRSIK